MPVPLLRQVFLLSFLNTRAGAASTGHARRHLVGEGRLFEPDVMLPAQYFTLLRKRSPQGPEYMLVIAMLQDAVECFQKYRFAIDENGRRAVTRTPTTGSRPTISKWPFSFENVCGDPEARTPTTCARGLFRWCERQDGRGGSGKVVPLNSRKHRPSASRVPVAATASEAEV